MLYLFPFGLIPKGSKIILYGAETVGYDFYRQVMTSKYCDIIKWVDRQYLWYRKMNLPVASPEDIASVDFDYAVVTAREEKTYLEIKKFLLKKGVSEEAVVWNDNYELMPDFVAVYDEERVKREAEFAKPINSIDCLTDNRMDVVVRAIYAKAFYEDRLSEFELSLYNRVIKGWNNFKEPTENIIVRYFSDYEHKVGETEFRQSFDKLLISVKEKGFRRDRFLPLDSKGRLCNGAHRCAAALALGVQAWGYKYEFCAPPYPYTRDWLIENGFTKEEVRFVYKQYEEMKGIRRK